MYEEVPMKRCLIYLDPLNPKNSLDLLEVARQVYATEAHETVGIHFQGAQHLLQGRFDAIIEVEHLNIPAHDAMLVTDVMEAVQEAHGFDCILIPATSFGRMLAPRLAMRLHVGLVADVTAIHQEEGTLEMVRPAFSGKIMAGITKQGKGPVMMTVRPNVFTYQEGIPKKTRHVPFQLQTRRPSAITCLEVKEKKVSYDIKDSAVLVSGGGGVARAFPKLKALADALHGNVSASRKIVDRGFVSRAMQVGQSGKTVQPKLYVALGIDGAIQHVEGLKNVEHIISVNTNRNAPICSLSDVVVVGDAAEFIDKLVEKIKHENGGQ